jgi:hypothetical protein
MGINMKSEIAGLFVILAAVFVCGPAVSAAGMIDFTGQKKLYELGGRFNEETPQLALDTTGHVFVAYTGTFGASPDNPGVFVDVSTGSDKSFSHNTINIDKTWLIGSSSQTTVAMTMPAMAIDKNSVVHVGFLWTLSTSTSTYVCYTYSTDSGRNFAPPVKISLVQISSATAPQMAVSGESVYITWTDIDNNVHLSRYSGGRKSKVDIKIPKQWGCYGQKMAVTPAGKIYIVWYGYNADSNSYKIVFARSVDDGMTFTYPAAIDDDNMVSSEPSIAAYGENKVYVTYTDTRTIYKHIRCVVSTDGGATFGASVPVSSETGGYNDRGSTVRVDGSGIIYAAWCNDAKAADTPDIFMAWSANGGSSFSAFQKINNIGGVNQFGYGSPSFDVDAAGTIQIAWKGEAVKDTSDQIYYSASINGVAPKMLAADSATSTTVSLSWQGVTFPRFRIDRSTDGQTWTTAVSPEALAAPNFTDTGLKPDTTYHYRVYGYTVEGTAVNTPATVTATTAQ